MLDAQLNIRSNSQVQLAMRRPMVIFTPKLTGFDWSHAMQVKYIGKLEPNVLIGQV